MQRGGQGEWFDIMHPEANLCFRDKKPVRDFF